MPQTRVKKPADITDLTAVELARDATSGRLPGMQVTKASLARLNAVSAERNAIEIPLFEQARARAREREDVKARGDALGLTPAIHCRTHRFWGLTGRLHRDPVVAPPL